MIKAENLKFKWSDKPIFDGVSFTVNDGEKVGLVGINGSGKTTLLKLISGIEQSDEGKIQVSGKVTFVPQEIKSDELMDSSKNIFDYLNASHKADYEIRRISSGLGLENLDLMTDAKVLSGGQKTRLALARAVLSEAKTLLLDEPTNFLDEKGKKWVVDFLGRFKGTVLIISHDMELLSIGLDKIFYINPQTKIIDIYSGNYNDFVKLKEEKEELLKRHVETETFETNEKRIDKNVSF
jgi:ATPase subunit of ABC transporter with duplicated ATPase domains